MADGDIKISFTFKLASIIAFFTLVFSIGMVYANYLNLESEFNRMKQREEVTCVRINELGINLSKINNNIEWIKEALDKRGNK
jgi:oligoribonuclease NrnB/cAMP/cGMP phosphodiesterase (DHH superfamily)